MIHPVNNVYDEDEAARVIASAIEEFYTSLLGSIERIEIDGILSSKNPYLFRVKSVTSPRQLVESILDAHISSSEETIFGNIFFEPLALAVSGGVKSGAEGIDIEVDRPPLRYAIAVKSGTSVFNSASKKRQKEEFSKHAKLMRQGKLKSEPVIGYGYGTKRNSAQGDASEYAGQDFWEFLTGDKEFYTKIIDLMGSSPEMWRSRFEASRASTLDRLYADFSKSYTLSDGSIDWNAILKHNSGSLARKERAELDAAKSECLEAMHKNPKASRKLLRETAGCSPSVLKRVIAELQDDGALEPGCDSSPWRLT